MSYDRNTQRISAPVGMYDIQQALSQGSPDLMTLCRASNINIWSRIKPCNYPSIDVMVPADYQISPTEDTNIIMSHQTKCSPNSHGGTWGIIFPNMQKYSYWISPADIDANKYLHDAPNGRDMNYARMKDFNGYSHGQPKPLGDPHISWNGNTFTCVMSFSQEDTYGIVPKNFDGNIYENIGWRPAVMVLSGSTYVGLYYCTAETQNNPIMLSDFPSSTTSITFTGTVPNTGEDYTFVGLLLAYKYVQHTTPAVETTWDRIHASSTDDSPCAIPMPNNRVTSTSGSVEPSIEIISLVGSDVVPQEGTEGMYYQSSIEFLYVTIRYYGGVNGYTFYQPYISAMIGSDGFRYVANNVTCGARQTVDVEYCFGITSTGTKICKVSVLCGDYSDYKEDYIDFI